jgi:nitrate/nitrite transporter NarK
VSIGSVTGLLGDAGDLGGFVHDPLVLHECASTTGDEFVGGVESGAGGR